jgi:hypothetical protein
MGAGGGGCGVGRGDFLLKSCLKRGPRAGEYPAANAGTKALSFSPAYGTPEWHFFPGDGAQLFVEIGTSSCFI